MISTAIEQLTDLRDLYGNVLVAINKKVAFLGCHTSDFIFPHVLKFTGSLEKKWPKTDLFSEPRDISNYLFMLTRIFAPVSYEYYCSETTIYTKEIASNKTPKACRIWTIFCTVINHNISMANGKKYETVIKTQQQRCGLLLKKQYWWQNDYWAKIGRKINFEEIRKSVLPTLRQKKPAAILPVVAML